MLTACVNLSRSGHHLAQVTDAESESFGVAWSCVHEVSHQQRDLQQFGESLALPKLLAGGRHRHHFRLHVIHLLLELELEEDGAQTGLQTLHWTDLETHTHMLSPSLCDCVCEKSVLCVFLTTTPNCSDSASSSYSSFSSVNVLSCSCSGNSFSKLWNTHSSRLTLEKHRLCSFRFAYQTFTHTDWQVSLETCYGSPKRPCFYLSCFPIILTVIFLCSRHVVFLWSWLYFLCTQTNKKLYHEWFAFIRWNQVFKKVGLDNIMNWLISWL